MSARRCRFLLVMGQPGPTYRMVAQEAFKVLAESGICETRELQPQTCERDLHWCDAMFVVRGYMPETARIARLARKMQRHVVAYWDDNPFEIPGRHIFQEAQNRQGIVDILQHANLIGVANPRLIEVLKGYSCAEGPALPLTMPAVGLAADVLPQRATAGVPVVGFGGHIAHAHELQKLVVPALEQLLRQGLKFRFEVIGPELSVSGELQAVTTRRDMMDFDEWVGFRNTCPWAVGLAPLPASSFHACKFIVKHIEYGAGGIAGVFSNVEPYLTAVRHRHTGMLAENRPEAWAEAIREVLLDAELHSRIVREAWQKISREHGRDAVRQSYVDVLGPTLQHRRRWHLGLVGATRNVVRCLVYGLGERCRSGVHRAKSAIKTVWRRTL